MWPPWPAAQLAAHGAERQVELVVHHQHPLGRRVQRAGRRAHRVARRVHEGLRDQQRDGPGRAAGLGEAPAVAWP